MLITGNYGRTLYRNENTGKTAFTFNTRDITPSLIKCYGVCQVYPTDMPLSLEGELQDGEFKFVKCAPFVNTKEKMVTFLSGKTFKGIGEKTAEKIYDFVGGNIFSFVVRDDAADLLAGEFNEKIAKELIVKVRSLSKVNAIYDTIEPYGGTMSSAIRIGEVAELEDFMADVYNIGATSGLSFGCCDGIARALKYSPYDERRVEAIVERAMNEVVSSGSVYTDIKTLTKQVNTICKSSAYTEIIPAPLVLATAFKNKKYRIKAEQEGVRYFSSYLYNAETSVVNGLLRLQNNAARLPFEDKIIEEIENECGIKYSDSQKKSFQLLKKSGVKVLTGGPGTGKSTVINGIVRAIKKMYPGESPLLCAPTGRAAQRLKEVTGEVALTIHRALNIVPYEDGSVNTTQIDSRFIIVDEASMIDVMLMKYLLESVSPSSFILFCGDIEQLPSVGPGNILNDMIASQKIEVVKLDVVYRCLTDSLISYNANNIRTGNVDVKDGPDFQYFQFKTEEEVKAKVEELVQQHHKKGDPFALQVLSPVKDGEAGTKALNMSLQKICNGKSDSLGEFDSYKYKISDKIIMMRNNYTAGYFNGDVGVVTDIADGAITVLLGDEKEIVLTNKDLEDVSPAYALTVHKSQGSEFSSVIIVLSEKHPVMLQRNLLYTAVTRAKKEVFIVAQGDAYKRAVSNTKMTERKTSLREKLTKGEVLYD